MLKTNRFIYLLLVAGVVVVFAIAMSSRPPAFPEAETIAVLPGPAWQVTWAVNSNQLMVEQKDGLLTLWDISESPAKPTIIDHQQNTWVTAVAISPSQEYLAAGFENDTVLIWDLVNNTPHYKSQPFKSAAFHIAWSSDSRMVAFPTDGISIVTVETATEVQRIEKQVSTLFWIPESNFLMGNLSDGTTGGAEIWDTETGNVVKKFLYTGHPGLLSPDGKKIFGYGIWDTATEQDISICGAECFVASLSFAWSPDSQHMATGGGRMCYDDENPDCISDFNIRVWNVETDVAPDVFSGHTDDVIDLVWHPDGSKITSISMDGSAQIWDMQTHTLLHSFYIGGFEQAELNSDGTIVATIDDETARILNLAIPASEQ